MELLKLSKTQAETISMLIGCIDYIATYNVTPNYTYNPVSNQAKDESLDIIILSIAEYVEKSITL
jgi:hypothetical protein